MHDVLGSIAKGIHSEALVATGSVKLQSTAGQDTPDCFAAVSDQDVADARRDMFIEFCHCMDRERIDYVILAGYGEYPEHIESDVDFMVSTADLTRLTPLLKRPGVIPGAMLLQVLQHETTACYFVLARQVGDRLAYLHPDASADFRRRGHLWLRAEDVLRGRRRHHAGFWIPSPATEFEYYFVKRVDKGRVEQRHLEALAPLLAANALGCRAVLLQLLRGTLAAGAERAVAETDTLWFADHCAELRDALASNAHREPIWSRIGNALADARRQLKRILQPTGLVLAVLGPDGSGKTTVIEHLERELAPAFRRVRRFHLRPRFGRAAYKGPVSNPHSQGPRSAGASVVKLLLFLLDYWSGWLVVVWPARVRSTLVIFDRYYDDLLIDPVRYRLSASFPPARWMASFVPRPDLWLILTAPAQTLVDRKGEIDLATAEALVAAYRQLANRMPNAIEIGTGSFLHVTQSQALVPLTSFLHRRTACPLPAR